MKKLIFTLFCFALTMQFSFAQHSGSAGSVQGIPTSQDSSLFNAGFDTTLLSTCAAAEFSAASDGHSGYINGSNYKNDEEKLEKYFIHGNKEIAGIATLIYSVHSNNASADTVNILLHDKNANVIGSAPIDLGTLSQYAVYSNGSASGGSLYFYPFTGNVAIYTADSIYVGITLPTIAGDTLAIACSPVGCDSSSGALAYDKRSDGTYHTTKSGWGVNIDYLIFPIYYFDASLSTSTGVTLNGLTINAAYPNPTNSSINISYAISQSSNVHIEVYNTIGQEVVTQSLGNQNPGKYTQNIDMSHLAKGTYFYSITTDNSKLFGEIAVQ